VVRKIKNRKAVGPDGIPVEAWKVLRRLGVDWLTRLFNRLLVGGKITDGWRKSYMIPIFKGKRDIEECRNNRGTKLMSHTIKFWEKVIDLRIRGETLVSKNPFGLCPASRQWSRYFV